MRLAAALEYNGSNFHGWQRQPAKTGLRTVQAELERALSRIADHEVQVACAGRTDAGVHALAQVVHFDVRKSRDMRAWLLGTNTQLPSDAKLRWVQPVAEDFHARFLAVGRRYRYVVHNHPARSALWAGRAAECPQKLDIEAMNAAAKLLHGEHDFSSFRGRDCQAKTPLKLMRELFVWQQGNWIVIETEASGFLHNMVRNITGSLLAVGRGDKPVSWMQDVLDAKHRSAAGETMPAYGLYFIEARYPERFQLPTIERDAFPIA